MLSQLNRTEQIDWLNDRVRFKLAPSPIHGVGLFALRDIPKGTHLHTEDFPLLFTLSYGDLDKLLPEVREQIIGQFPNIINGARFAWPTVRWQAYCNHASKPNYNTIEDITLKDIAVGEEITQDYRLIANAEKIFDFIKK